MEFNYFTLEDLFNDVLGWLTDVGTNGEERFVSYVNLQPSHQRMFVQAFETLNKYCEEVKIVGSNNAVTSQAGEVAMMFYMEQSPRMFMIAYTVKPEYLQYEQTFATCCRYFTVKNVLAVFNAYFDYLETKRE